MLTPIGYLADQMCGILMLSAGAPVQMLTAIFHLPSILFIVCLVYMYFIVTKISDYENTLNKH